HTEDFGANDHPVRSKEEASQHFLTVASSSRGGESNTRLRPDDLNRNAGGVSDIETVVQVLFCGQPLLLKCSSNGGFVEAIYGDCVMVDDAGRRFMVERDDGSSGSHSDDLIRFILVQDRQPENLFIKSNRAG